MPKTADAPQTATPYEAVPVQTATPYKTGAPVSETVPAQTAAAPIPQTATPHKAGAPQTAAPFSLPVAKELFENGSLADIGFAVFSARTAAGQTMAQAAKAAGISRGELDVIETGAYRGRREVDAAALFRLIRLYNIKLEIEAYAGRQVSAPAERRAGWNELPTEMFCVRQSLGLTVAETAGLTGLSERQIEDAELMRRPPEPDAARRLAAFYADRCPHGLKLPPDGE